MTKTDRERQRKAPILRFKGFTDDWEQRKLKNLITEPLSYGLSVSSKEYDGIHKYLRITDIDEKSRKFNKDKLTSPDIKFNSSSKKYLLSNNDIVFARTGASTGKTYMYQKEDGIVYYAGFLIKASLSSNFDNNFIFQQTYRKRYYQRVKVISQRSGQPGINSKEYGNFDFLITQIEEQNKIGKLFKIFDNLLALYERKTKLIKQIQSSFLDKFFFEPNNVTSLNHFLRIRNGYAFKSSKLTENGEIPVVRISNIGNDKSFAFTTKEKNKEQFALYPNDIVIALSGATAGKINQVSNKYPLYYQNQRVGFFERKNDKLDYEYLNSFLHSKKFKSQLQKTLVAGAQPNIAPKDIEKIKIPFIGYKLQQKIGQVNKYLFELQRINKSKFTLLDKIKKTLLNNMFV